MPSNSESREVRQFTTKKWKEQELQPQGRTMQKFRETFARRVGRLANIFGVRQRNFTREILMRDEETLHLWRDRHNAIFSRNTAYAQNLDHARDISEAAAHNLIYFRRMAREGPEEHRERYQTILEVMEQNPNAFKTAFNNDLNNYQNSSILNAFRNLRGTFNLYMSRKKVNRIFDEHSPGISEALMHVYENHAPTRTILETLRDIHFKTPARETGEHEEGGHPQPQEGGGREREIINQLQQQLMQQQQQGHQPIHIEVNPTISPTQVVSPEIKPYFNNRPEVNRQDHRTDNRNRGLSAADIAKVAKSLRVTTPGARIIQVPGETRVVRTGFSARDVTTISQALKRNAPSVQIVRVTSKEAARKGAITFTKADFVRWIGLNKLKGSKKTLMSRSGGNAIFQINITKNTQK